jgi:hypothetical protein
MLSLKRFFLVYIANTKYIPTQYIANNFTLIYIILKIDIIGYNTVEYSVYFLPLMSTVRCTLYVFSRSHDTYREGICKLGIDSWGLLKFYKFGLRE